MTELVWDDRAADVLRKLPKDDAERIVAKLRHIALNVERYLEKVVGQNFNKVRIGDYRLFVDFDRGADLLFIRDLRHRRNAYKYGL